MSMRRFCMAAALFGAASLPAFADDAAALMLADQTEFAPQAVRDWRLFAEFAAGDVQRRDGSTRSEGRLSLDLMLDTALAPGWRFVLADRLDVSSHAEAGRERQVNTLKEAYVSWQARDDLAFDGGRINLRNGVASGYNPTDYFRERSNRNAISADPGTQKKNRQGSVMARVQTLWDGGAFSAAFSPKLAGQPSASTWSADLGATNARDRWLLTLSQRIGADLQPQWLLFGEQGRSPQLGFNLAVLASDALVVYGEWSGGRSRSLLSQALNSADDTRFRQRGTVGLTWTAAGKLSLTAEYQYNGAGMQAEAWRALPLQSPLAYGQYRRTVQALQEMPTREALFFYANWQDVAGSRIDVNAMLRHNRADRSRLAWLEARYHWDRSEVALQWQHNIGSRSSEYGAAPQRRVLQAVWRQYF